MFVDKDPPPQTMLDYWTVGAIRHLLIDPSLEDTDTDWGGPHIVVRRYRSWNLTLCVPPSLLAQFPDRLTYWRNLAEAEAPELFRPRHLV